MSFTSLQELIGLDENSLEFQDKTGFKYAMFTYII